MGKHSSNNHGLPGFGKRGGGARKNSAHPFGPGAASGPKAAKRKVPTRAAGKAPLGPGSARRGPDDERYQVSDAKKRKKGPLESAPARLRIEKERRNRRLKRLAITIVSAIGILLVLAAAGTYAYAKHIERTMQKTVVRQEKLKAVLAEAKAAEPYNVLILGGDHRAGEERYRTDTMIIARIDPKTKQVWMLSIPRDTKVNIPGHGDSKINQAFYFGGPEGAVEAASDLTGVEINHYMEVNFRGFEKAVDALGGVWVDVPTEIDDWKAASHSKGHRAKHIDAGYQLLDGEHALTFVRSRDYPDADFSRMKSQQLFFKALADQVAKKENIAKLPRVVSSVAPYVGTDMTLMEMLRTAQALKSAGSGNVYTASLKGEWKSPYVYVDEEQMAKLVDLMESGRSFDPTKSVEPSASATGTAKAGAKTDTQDAPAEIDPADISITVRNGAGIAGCAKQASSVLKTRGFDVAETGNANQFVYDKTLVVYKDAEDAAKLVAAGLPPGVKLVQSRGMYAFDTDILVVIGKDWDVSKVPVTPVEVES